MRAEANGVALAAQQWVVTEGWDAGRGRWCCLELRPARSGEVVETAERTETERQAIYSRGVLIDTVEVNRRRSRQRVVSGVEAVRMLRERATGL